MKKAFELANKQAKLNAKKIEETLGYKNGENPFGDKHLVKPFIWKERIKQMAAIGKVEELSEDQLIR